MGAKDLVERLPLEHMEVSTGFNPRETRCLRLATLEVGKIRPDGVVLVELGFDVAVHGDKLLDFKC